MSRHVLVALVLCGLAGSVAAQGMGDAARKESERRARIKGSSRHAVKVYTAEDLRRGAPDTPSEPSAAAAGTPTDLGGMQFPPGTELPPGLELPPGVPGMAARPSPASSGSSARGGRTESDWRSRAKGLTEDIGRLEREVALADRVATGLAYDGPVDRHGRPNTRHPQAVARADGAREALDKARKAREDFEEKARRAGVPPGWLR